MNPNNICIRIRSRKHYSLTSVEDGLRVREDRPKLTLSQMGFVKWEKMWALIWPKSWEMGLVKRWNSCRMGGGTTHLWGPGSLGSVLGRPRWEASLVLTHLLLACLCLFWCLIVQPSACFDPYSLLNLPLLVPFLHFDVQSVTYKLYDTTQQYPTFFLTDFVSLFHL